MKPRKPIRKVSVAMAKRKANYAKVKAKFLFDSDNKYCGACRTVRKEMPHHATEVHHRRGRISSLLTDTRYFIAICKTCHSWIHNNIQAARELGLIANLGEWNKVPRD